MKKFILFLLFLIGSFAINAQTMDRITLRDNRVKQMNCYKIENGTKVLEWVELVNDSGLVYKALHLFHGSSGVDTIVYMYRYLPNHKVQSDTSTLRGTMLTGSYDYPGKNTVRHTYYSNGKPGTVVVSKFNKGKSVSRDYDSKGVLYHVYRRSEVKNRSRSISYHVRNGKRTFQSASRSRTHTTQFVTTVITDIRTKKERFTVDSRYEYGSNRLLIQRLETRTDKKSTPTAETRYVYEYIFR